MVLGGWGKHAVLHRVPTCPCGMALALWTSFPPLSSPFCPMPWRGTCGSSHLSSTGVGATTFTFHSLNNGVMIAMRSAEHANRKHRCWSRPRVQILAFPQPDCATWTTLQWHGASLCLAVLICEMDTGIEPASWGHCQGGAIVKQAKSTWEGEASKCYYVNAAKGAVCVPNPKPLFSSGDCVCCRRKSILLTVR